MGTYGIGLGRLLAAAIEQNHDDKGIIWPLGIAPYQVYLCPLRLEIPDVAQAAEKVYKDLIKQNIEVLFDDREESPGVKFNDADLLGIPLRLTISPRTLQSQSIELKWRKEKQAELVPLQGIELKIDKLIRQAG
jgi:prolyl-tRNA synthetase